MDCRLLVEAMPLHSKLCLTHFSIKLCADFQHKSNSDHLKNILSIRDIDHLRLFGEKVLGHWFNLLCSMAIMGSSVYDDDYRFTFDCGFSTYKFVYICKNFYQLWFKCWRSFFLQVGKTSSIFCINNVHTDKKYASLDSAMRNWY